MEGQRALTRGPDAARRPRTGLTRRRLLLGGGAAGVAGAGAAAAALTGGDDASPVALPPLSAGEPRQHAWDATLRRDAHDNVLAPRFHRLLLCDLVADPTPARARAAEAGLRRLERALPRSAAGVLVVVGWGPAWFRRIGVASPVPRARALSPTEAPAIDDPVAIVHLAADDEARLDRVERALLHGGTLRGARGSVSLTDLLRVRARRTGFVGAGLPRARQRDVVGLPGDRAIDRDAPLYMGFQSGLRRNQATEDDVTIAEGPWRGGTTMHVSTIELTLDTWYHGVDQAGRVRRMFAADATPQDLERRPDGIANPVRDLRDVARRRGVVGHAESMASVRRDDRPIILRRDFDSRDGDAAQVHFVALQRSIEDFERTRRAMNAARAIDASAGVGAQVNNGINEWLNVTARGNYLVPPRARRTCPGLPGWSA
ncbi:hypothetical protein SK069_18730 [Patulibacter brassicae]|uniref:Dyp-type peroxidase n=1 Tax=Patulibacter brassicae TaxID=1705717 RepID=A0ABU4VP50_9ACTN|nr:hypothetical protein [Patulibacter brassicae]MDX8153640.1 hypothetical protein [Patulibacter brassicae]